MKIQPLGIEGALEVVPMQHVDARGTFAEWYRFDEIAAEVGHPLRLAQANLSVSAAGVLRGVHYADVPPGQAKYVSCVRGAGIDVIVDIRVGSADQHELTDDATLLYLCSEPYAPQREHAVHAFDPDLGIDWPIERPFLSARDAAAPTLAEARRLGRLPDFAVCAEYTRSLRTG
jgi:dTDP-4-dehydrorhamnose 3,5-epimerase